MVSDNRRCVNKFAKPKPPDKWQKDTLVCATNTNQGGGAGEKKQVCGQVSKESTLKVAPSFVFPTATSHYNTSSGNSSIRNIQAVAPPEQQITRALALVGYVVALSRVNGRRCRLVIVHSGGGGGER